MILTAVFASSVAALSFEVLLTRLFAVTQWHHLSFVAISVAMLGTAAAGVLVETRHGLRGDRRLAATALSLLPLAMLAAFQATSRIRLDYFRLAVDPSQLGRLAVLFLALACPFALAGLVTAAAYTRHEPARVYFASMAGSALGALAPAALLPAIGLGSSFVAAALLPVVPAIALARSCAGTARRLLSTLAWAAVPGSILFLAVPSLLEVRPNEYKALAQYGRTPGVTVVARHEDLRARYDEVAGEGVRFAPGLSLRYTDALPAARLILEDGDRRHVLPDAGDPRAAALARSLLASGAYVVPPRVARVLILHADGGTSVIAALAARAPTIDLLTDQPYLARRFAEHYGPRLSRVIEGPARAFLAAPGELYDVIQVESWGTQLPAMASLAEDRWITVESVRALLARLAPGGVLAFNRALDLPPNDLQRLLGTAWKALATGEPWLHTAALRSWDSLLVVVGRERLEARALERLAAFAERLRFDPVQMPGLTAATANRYNQMARPYHFEAAQALAAGTLDRSSPFDVSPVTDSRPFPYHYLRWKRLAAAWRLLADRLYSLMLSGEVMLLLLVASAAAAAALILLLPARIAGGRSPAATGTLVALGAGAMLCEIGWLQSLGLLLESPSIAFAVGVGTLLLASGLAAFACERRHLGLAVAAAAALASTGVAAGFAAAAPALLALPAWQRLAVAVAALALTGLLMGAAFPTALRAVGDGAARAHAWAANGAAAVVASTLAPLIAISWGIPAVFAAAAACYAAALARALARARVGSRHAGTTTTRGNGG